MVVEMTAYTCSTQYCRTSRVENQFESVFTFFFSSKIGFKIDWGGYPLARTIAYGGVMAAAAAAFRQRQ